MINTASNGPYEVCPLGFLEVKVTGLTYFLSTGNCLFKVFSLIYFKKNWKEYTLREYFWVRLAFFTFLYFPVPLKFYSFTNGGETSKQLKVKNKNEEQKQIKTPQ